jgi:hypothetical protein
MLLLINRVMQTDGGIRLQGAEPRGVPYPWICSSSASREHPRQNRQRKFDFPMLCPAISLIRAGARMSTASVTSHSEGAKAEDDHPE